MKCLYVRLIIESVNNILDEAFYDNLQLSQPDRTANEDTGTMALRHHSATATIIISRGVTIYPGSWFPESAWKAALPTLPACAHLFVPREITDMYASQLLGSWWSGGFVWQPGHVSLTYHVIFIVKIHLFLNVKRLRWFHVLQNVLHGLEVNRLFYLCMHVVGRPDESIDLRSFDSLIVAW